MYAVELADKVAFVTGAARGIGLSAAHHLLQAGCKVVLNARAQSEETRDVFSDLEAAHPGAIHVVYGSAADSVVVKQAGQMIFSKFKRLDIVVNNAGILRDNMIGMIPDDEMTAVMENNVISVLKVTQMAGRLMMRHKSGSIINLASIIGRRGNKGQLVYGASKAAVIGATLSASKELAPNNIRVNAVAPGLIETRMTEGIPSDTKQKLQAQIGMSRLGTAEDVARVILFLACDLSTYVTGQVIGVDGGLVL
jgi:3-oxoacyl-[acyl-carrier protein] reductase